MLEKNVKVFTAVKKQTLMQDVSKGCVPKFLIFFVLYRVKLNRRGYDDPRTPKNLTISYCLRTEIARKWEFRHCTIAVSLS